RARLPDHPPESQRAPCALPRSRLTSVEIAAFSLWCVLCARQGTGTNDVPRGGLWNRVVRQMMLDCREQPLEPSIDGGVDLDEAGRLPEPGLLVTDKPMRVELDSFRH